MDTVSESNESNDRDAYPPDILLKFDARVVGDENIESRVDGGSEQNTVPKPEPALSTNSGRLMAGHSAAR